MARINENYLKLTASYLFSDIAKRVRAFEAAHPDRPVIRMGIGDVTEPLPAACREAMHKAIDEMGTHVGFHGYGPEQGYPFLREAIAAHDYQARGCEIQANEIFVSDGSKCDCANIQEIFSADCTIAIPDPVYPVYVDSNVMAGRTGSALNGRYQNLVYLDSTQENGYVPTPPATKVDLVYLCFPNNPTGACATRAQLAAWVDYARENNAILLYDAAYEAFIRDPELPRSIYEIPGARDCAIEFRSFSKTAGFTGTRCAFTVVPESLLAYSRSGEPIALHFLWNRRHTTKFNGVSYPVQRAAAAVYSAAGQQQVGNLIRHYMDNADLIRSTMEQLGYPCAGGRNAPYVWIRIPSPSWEFFDTLLNQCAIVCTPGAGFGSCGEYHVRLSAFNSRAKVEEAMSRLRTFLG